MIAFLPARRSSAAPGGQSADDREVAARTVLKRVWSGVEQAPTAPLPIGKSNPSGATPIDLVDLAIDLDRLADDVGSRRRSAASRGHRRARPHGDGRPIVSVGRR